jgi:hypothetical protein
MPAQLLAFLGGAALGAMAREYVRAKGAPPTQQNVAQAQQHLYSNPNAALETAVKIGLVKVQDGRMYNQEGVPLSFYGDMNDANTQDAAGMLQRNGAPQGTGQMGEAGVGQDEPVAGPTEGGDAVATGAQPTGARDNDPSVMPIPLPLPMRRNAGDDAQGRAVAAPGGRGVMASAPRAQSDVIDGEFREVPPQGQLDDGFTYDQLMQDRAQRTAPTQQALPPSRLGGATPDNVQLGPYNPNSGPTSPVPQQQPQLPGSQAKPSTPPAKGATPDATAEKQVPGKQKRKTTQDAILDRAMEAEGTTSVDEAAPATAADEAPTGSGQTQGSTSYSDLPDGRKRYFTLKTQDGQDAYYTEDGRAIDPFKGQYLDKPPVDPKHIHKLVRGLRAL